MAGPNLFAATSLKQQLLYSGQIATTAETTLYTVPANTGVTLKNAVICNTTSSAVNVSVSVVPSGGTADGTHRVINVYPLAANDSYSLKDYLGDQELGAGDFISVLCGTGAAVDVTVSGLVTV